MKVLFVSPVPTHPVNAGHRARIWALVRLAREAGHDVWFAHIEREMGEPPLMDQAFGPRFVRVPWREPESAKVFRRSVAEPGLRRRLWQRGFVSMALDDWWDPGVEAPLRELHERERFDAVCVEYVFASAALRCFPGARTLLDTHDRFGGRARVLARHGIEPNFFYTTRRREGKALGRAQVVLAIQEDEARYFRRTAPRTTRVVTVSHAIDVCEPPAGCRGPDKPVLFYCGSDNSANVHGMEAFLRRAWPDVRARAPGVELRLAGSICSKAPEADGVVKLGRVEDLASEYHGATAVVNPTVFGTGIKIKSLEALGHGVPLVTTPEGAKGLGAGEVAGVLVGDSKTLAPAVSRVLGDAALRARMREGALRFAHEWNARQRQALAEALGA